MGFGARVPKEYGQDMTMLQTKMERTDFVDDVISGTSFLTITCYNINDYMLRKTENTKKMSGRSDPWPSEDNVFTFIILRCVSISSVAPTLVSISSTFPGD